MASEGLSEHDRECLKKRSAVERRAWEGESKVLCIRLSVRISDEIAREIVIEYAHSILAHLGARKMLSYLREQVWWKEMVSDIAKYCDTCHTCKTSKPKKSEAL